MSNAFVSATVCFVCIFLTSSVSAADDCAFTIFNAPNSGLGDDERLPTPPAVQDGTFTAGTTFPDPSLHPYRNFFGLDTIVNGVSRFCTAQVVGATNVLLTAAHCVQDNGNGNWVNRFQLRDLRNSSAQPIVDPKCIMTNKTWTNMPKGFPGRFYWPADYALVFMPSALNEAFLELGAKPPGTVSVQAFGLPTGIGRHDRLVDINGDLEDDADQAG